MSHETAHTLAILARLTGGVTVIPDQPPCPDLQDGEHCDGNAHYLGDPTTTRPRPPLARFCPGPARREMEARLQAELLRLAGPLRDCPGGFASYDPGRQPVQACARCGRPPGPDGWRCAGHRTEIVRPRDLAAAALAAVQAFAEGPPRRGVLLAGSLGLGKTHLLLAAHLALLTAGVRSYFVNSTDLRELFVGLDSFGEARLEEAQKQRQRLVSAQAILWDDAGDVDGDERYRGRFAEGLKYLLDRSRAVWAISTNLRYAQAEQHPDLGAKALSRLLKGAVVIRLEGRDQRLVRGQTRFPTEAA